VPPAAHRLSLLLLPGEPDAASEIVLRLRDRLRGDGFLAGDTPGPRALVDGGFDLARAEVFDEVRFASSGQGGFAVRCPVDGTNVVGAFNRALPRWRAGGPRRLACTCGREHDLTELRYLPDAGFARGWLALIDVQSVELTPEGRAAVTAVMPDVRILVRRG
jgi:hypothetical protein